MQVRLIPMLSWYTSAHRVRDLSTLTPPARLMMPKVSSIVWILWMWGVPALAVGFFVNGIPLLTAGAIVLEAAVVLGAWQIARAAWHVFARSPQLSCPDDSESRGTPPYKPTLQTAQR
jgi:hypothetical protein